MHAPALPRTAAAQLRPGPPEQRQPGPPRAFLDLGAVLTAPGCARAWTREILWEWRLSQLANTAELIVSEMITNSVTDASGLDQPAIRLILTLDQGELAILVRDGNPGIPQARNPGQDDENGRGLLLVEALSTRFGRYPLQGQDAGKVVWAIIRS